MPAGNPLNMAPVAPVVLKVVVVRGEFTHIVWFILPVFNAIVLAAVTVIVPEAVPPQLPVKVTV
jgi:hypothetical protein